MRNLKKFLALILAMMMTLSLMVTVNASSFSDDDDITTEYGEAVDVLTSLNVIKGYSDGSFLPKEKITRAEVAAIIYRLYTGDVDDDNIHLYKGFSEFSDVAGDKWYTPYVNFCANNGLVNGVGNNRFAPSSYVTGYEALVMILRAIGYNNPSEFSSSDWKFKASGYGSRLGITANVPAGSLGAEATREMVAEIMFQGLLVPTVTYSPLTMYTQNILVEAGTLGNDDGATVVYPNNVYSTLMYEVFKIVGKAEALTYDPYGRPSYRWVRDNDEDSIKYGSKYVVNQNSTTWEHDTQQLVDEKAFDIAMIPVKVYDNAIDECHLVQAINSDKSIAWTKIHEALNGKTDRAATFATATGLNKSGTGDLDALHTTTKYIGQTGRTTEIYKEPSGEWVFVYIDTFLGEVISTKEATKDTAGHVIEPATAIVHLGNNAGSELVELKLENKAGYKVGDLVLVQTHGGVDDTFDVVDNPEKAPVTPTDVPATAAEFKNGATVYADLLSNKTQRVQGVISATVGQQDAKMGVIVNGTTYYASNTFLAARTTNTTVLDDWYDVDSATLGITNSMIGRTYDIVLDHHGYIVGLKEIAPVDSTVGVITGVDAKRIGTGKYVTSVEAFMSDGSTKTFDVVGIVDGKDLSDAVDADLKIWASANESDTAWSTGGKYGDHIGVGSLVMFKQITIEGQSYWKIDDYSKTVATTALAAKYVPIGTVKGDAVVGDKAETGVTNTFKAVGTAKILDDDSTIFVAEYDFRYNTGNDNNTGSNVDKSYSVYEGFKKMPTVNGKAGENNVMYQQLTKNPEYVLVYAADPEKEYIIRNQATITVDESYLVLSRGATYAEYSEYNVLKNGQPDVLRVSNVNTEVNKLIEATMDSQVTGVTNVSLNDLVVVTGRNAKGYVTAATTIEAQIAAGDAVSQAVAKANVGNTYTTLTNNIITGSNDVAYAAGVLTIDGSNHYLTVDGTCKVQIINRDLGTTYDSSLAEAVMYANGVDKDAADDNLTLPEHNLVFELNQYGYVCNIYIID